MEKATLAQQKELERLETAAEHASEPEQIAHEASKQHHAPALKAPTWWFVPYLILAAIFGAGLLLLDWNRTHVRAALAEKIWRYLLGGLAITAVLTIARGIEVYVIARVRNVVSRFNLKRILRLVLVLLTPISSFIGWVYILVRAPYRVGDRIQIGEARGDVIDVSYLDTTLWEIGGRHLSTDHPSGRIIKFPNTNVSSTAVYNYSWPLFPYVWNEIKFNLAYESDLEFVATTMSRIAAEELGESMMEKVKLFRDLLARTPVDQLDVQERPNVVFRVSENTWLEAIVRYLVHPKEAGRVKSRLTRKLLAALNAEPERVLFPKSNMR